MIISRFNLALEACQNQQSGTVKERLWQVFERYGLPNRILCDNGSPWGSAKAPVPTRSSVFGFCAWALS